MDFVKMTKQIDFSNACHQLKLLVFKRYCLP